jgi:23S rRNA (uridine2552-2'-O)-methyltransferase
VPKPYTPNDKWSQRAAKEGYRARSVYKLMQLDERFGLLRPGMTVLDFGAAPGSWLQYTSTQIGPRGKAVGFDLQAIAEVAPNVSVYRMDIANREKLTEALASEGITQADLVLSDIAPNTSGVKDIDQFRSVELTLAVLDLAGTYLKPGGFCAAKVFRGGDFDDMLREIKRSGMWRDIRVTKVAASRDRSREVYLVLRKKSE